jgi:hypothetical protein
MNIKIAVHMDGMKTAQIAVEFEEGTGIDDVFVLAHRLGRAYGVQDTDITVTHPFPFAGTEVNLIEAWNRFVMGEGS